MGNLNKIRAIIGKNDIGLPNLEIARYSSDRAIKLTTTAVAINFQSMNKLYKHLKNVKNCCNYDSSRRLYS